MKRHLATLAAAVALTIVAATAWAYWTSGSVPGGNGAAAASALNQGATPSVSAVGHTLTVSWTPGTLSSGQAVSGYLVKRYDAGTLAPQTILSACAGTVTATSCVESNVPNGSWKYAITPVFATNWQGLESAKSATAQVVVDPTAPVNAITLSSVTGGAFLSSGTVYYRGAAAGSLRVTNAVTDAGPGPASSQTSTLTGTSTGWTHTGSTVSTPSGGPYESNPFVWSAATTTSPQVTVTGRDADGNSAPTTLSMINDSTAPTASVSYPDGSSTGTSVTVTLSASDGGAGIETRLLQRASAALTGSTCGPFGSFATVAGGINPSSPVSDPVAQDYCYQYRYVIDDHVGNQQIATSASVVSVLPRTYVNTINTANGLVSYYRMGEATTSADSMAGTAGATLQSRNGEVGATWTKHASSNADAVLTDAGRLRKNGTSTGQSLYSASAQPATPNYTVEADVYVRSNLAGDMAGVVGRMDPSNANGTYYLVRYEQSGQKWVLYKRVNGSFDWLGESATQALTSLTTYRLALDMSGTTIRVLVDGVQLISATDSAISAAGRGGVLFGFGGAATTVTNLLGFHVDNFRISPPLIDSKSSNHGTWFGGATLGATGAIAGESNTAASFDGLNDFSTAARQISDDFSIEFWFKSTQGIGTGSDWSAGAGLVDASVPGAANDFGVSLRSDGRLVAGVGTPDVSIVSTSGGHNNGAWHHVVFTRTQSTGALALYVDGAAAGTATAHTAALTSPTSISFGRVLGGSNFFLGSLDEVVLYNTPLSGGTIASHYSLGSVGQDLVGPTGGSVDASGLVGTGSRYAASTTLSLVLAKGTDPSGVATTGNTLVRATATLASGSCGTFGTYTLIAGGTDPVSPKTDVVIDQACYKYRYVVLDTLNNAATYTSPDIKVDLTAPAAPSLAHTLFTNTWWPGSGATVYYRSAASSGSFSATATATDTVSGIASYGFPALGTNWTSTPGALGVNTYSWSGAPAAPGTQNVTATNNAAGTSSNSPFTLTVDDTAPSAGTVTPPNATQTSTTVSVAYTTGTDSGSGLGTRLLKRQSAPLTGTTCGTYGGWTTAATNPVSSPFSDTVTGGFCHRYQYLVSDNVGNQDTASSANVVAVSPVYADTVLATTGLYSYWRMGDAVGSTVMDEITATNNNGTYFNAPTRGVAGALPGDANTAVQFNGTNQYATAVRQLSGSFSLEIWVKSTQNYANNPACAQWNQGAGLIDAIVGPNGDDFGISMCSGKILAGVGSPDVTIVSSATYNDGSWHHVVFTRTQTSGAIALYVDGASVGTATGSTSALTSAANLNFGRSNSTQFYFAGTLDEAALYNTVLSPATVTSHYGAR
ncbi:hypothetical protein GCM10023350_14200 [Nocardioides endophyticus]|uniref:Laminin G domain-containing protein n=1 Tax=Nocardioides endophyticus TaxID=1353775 RepID=A0ABP8YN09_9ACTN